MKKKIFIFTALSLQVIFLLGMIAYHSLKLKSATVVMLKTVPVDPVSLFRGYYVDLNYEISTLPFELLKGCDEETLKNGQELFVQLEKKGESWEAVGVYCRKPPEDVLYLRARVNNPYYYYYPDDQIRNRPLRLEYGIESFFLNESKAKEVDEANRRAGVSWERMEAERANRIQALDPQTQRIYNVNIKPWWVDLLVKESEFWVADGLLTPENRQIIIDGYTQAMEKIKAVDEGVRVFSAPGAELKTESLYVEVAIDRQGNGYPRRLFLQGKEYR